jgi:hypothetical protein
MAARGENKAIRAMKDWQLLACSKKQSDKHRQLLCQTIPVEFSKGSKAAAKLP